MYLICDETVIYGVFSSYEAAASAIVGKPNIDDPDDLEFKAMVAHFERNDGCYPIALAISINKKEMIDR